MNKENLFEIANAITKNEIVDITTIKKLTSKYTSVQIIECDNYHIVKFTRTLNGTRFVPTIIKKKEGLQ